MKSSLPFWSDTVEENFVKTCFLVTPFIDHHRHLTRLIQRSDAAQWLRSLFKLLGAGNVAVVGGLLPPLLAARCDVQLSNPLPILTAGTMTRYLAVPKRDRSDIGVTGSIHLQCSHVTRGAKEARRTWSFGENAIVACRPFAYKKETEFARLIMYVNRAERSSSLALF